MLSIVLHLSYIFYSYDCELDGLILGKKDTGEEMWRGRGELHASEYPKVGEITSRKEYKVKTYCASIQ